MRMVNFFGSSPAFTWRHSIGIETVRTHARNIYRKLGIASRRELPRLARRDPVSGNGQGRPPGG